MIMITIIFIIAAAAVVIIDIKMIQMRKLKLGDAK